MQQKPLIFTDMDGTLLDHHTYSFEPVLPLLVKLKQQDITVVPNTSKTFDELLVLRTQIGLDGPFIIENGAAVCFPEGLLTQQPANTYRENGYLIRPFTQTRQHWLGVLEQLKSEFADCLTHFAQMSIDDICAATGLSAEDAKRAASRRFGEPVLWQSDETRKQAFIKAAEALGATPLQGGRFIHICGECDKGVALRWLSEQYQSWHSGSAITSIALGDSQNDVAMLEAADIAVRISSPTHTLPILQRSDNVHTSSAHGPEGWAEVMSELFKQFS